jgi:very-short-patch-repair endonuclease
MRKLMKLAGKQHGAFSAAQAKGLGVTPDQLRGKLKAGIIERAAWGVYRLVGSPRTWRQRVMIAVLAGGPGAAASGRCAAALLGLRGYREGPVEVTQTRRPSRRHPVVHAHEHSSRFLPAHQIKVIDGIPVLCVERVVFELCSRASLERAKRIVKDAVGHGFTTLARLGTMLAETGKRGRKGTVELRIVLGILSEDHAPTESELEDLVVAVLLAAGLPTPDRQIDVGGLDTPVGRIDFLYRIARLIIEADSKAHHGDWAATEADQRRDKLLVTAGFQVIHTNWRELLAEPEILVNAVRAVLGRAAHAA